MKVRSLVAGGAALAVSVASQAAAVDVTSTVTEIGAQAAPIALVAGAVLAIHVGVKAFKWVRRALS
jgi:hypothetical protein